MAIPINSYTCPLSLTLKRDFSRPASFFDGKKRCIKQSRYLYILATWNSLEVILLEIIYAVKKNKTSFEHRTC